MCRQRNSAAISCSRARQKTAANTREAKAGHGGGGDEEDRKRRVEMEAVEQLCDGDGVHHVRWADGDVGHHVDRHMFFDIEGAGVEAEFSAAENLGQNPAAGGEHVRKSFSKQVCDEKHDGGRDEQCRVRKLRNASRHAPMRTSVRPRNHIRKVVVGISGSSMLLTLMRTSAKGVVFVFLGR